MEWLRGRDGGGPSFPSRTSWGPFCAPPSLPMPRRVPQLCPPGGEELRAIAKQAPGQSCAGPKGVQGGSWHAKQLGAGTVPAPRVVPGRRVDVLWSHLHREDGPAPLLAAAGTAPVTARCPASPAGSAPQPVSWRCRGSCLRAGKGCSADLRWEKARRLAERRGGCDRHPPPPRSRPIWVGGCSGEARPAARRDRRSSSYEPPVWGNPSLGSFGAQHRIMALMPWCPQGRLPAWGRVQLEVTMDTKPRRGAKSCSPCLRCALAPSPAAPTLPTEDSPR